MAITWEQIWSELQIGLRERRLVETLGLGKKREINEIVEISKDGVKVRSRATDNLNSIPRSSFHRVWRKLETGEEKTMESLVGQRSSIVIAIFVHCLPKRVELTRQKPITLRLRAITPEQENSRSPEVLSEEQVVELPATPDASDLAEPPQRQQFTTYRILRDSPLARRIKAIHKNECQICGHTIILPDGSRYSEAHHIHPLGLNGPDRAENILCLCPNHHAELDYGVRTLSLKDLRTLPEHSIAEGHLRFHNEQIHTKAD